MTPEERQAWLATRRTGIGSSDIAAICGLSPYRSALEVYADKLGLLPDRDNDSMAWGRWLEPVVAEVYADRMGVRLVQPELRRHELHPWALASVDRISEPDGLIVECKTSRTHEGWGDPWTDRVPEDYLVQVVWQLGVWGLPEAHVPCMFGIGDLVTYSIVRSDNLFGRLLSIGRDFWRRVEDRDPPPSDWADPRTAEIIPLLYGPEPDHIVTLSPAALPLVAEYEAAAARLAAANRETEDAKLAKDTARARIIEEHIGHAAIAVLPDGRQFKRRLVEVGERMAKAYSYELFTLSQPKKAKVRA